MSSYLTCLCGGIKTPFVSDPSSHLPIPTSLCHCNPCRQASGALWGAFPSRGFAKPPDEVLNACTHYASLGPTGLQRYFCSRCGTQICIQDAKDGQWHGCSGAIETEGSPAICDRVKITGHIFATDPLDGGILAERPGLAKLRYGEEQAKDVPCYSQWSHGETIPYSAVKELAEKSSSVSKPEEGEWLHAKCHCGGTDLRIRRANYAQDDQGVKPDHMAPEKDKYVAYLCACRSCRLGNGVATFQPWTSVPPANVVVTSTGKNVVFGRPAMDNGANQGTTLKQFWSSKNVCWSFCGTCGASIFYWHDGRPDVVDVAVGILRAEEGTLAKNWLGWKWDDIGYHEEVVDQELYRAIVGK
jgi:hypothetical protein